MQFDSFVNILFGGLVSATEASMVDTGAIRRTYLQIIRDTDDLGSFYLERGQRKTLLTRDSPSFTRHWAQMLCNIIDGDNYLMVVDRMCDYFRRNHVNRQINGEYPSDKEAITVHRQYLNQYFHFTILSNLLLSGSIERLSIDEDDLRRSLNTLQEIGMEMVMHLIGGISSLSEHVIALFCKDESNGTEAIDGFILDKNRSYSIMEISLQTLSNQVIEFLCINSPDIIMCNKSLDVSEDKSYFVQFIKYFLDKLSLIHIEEDFVNSLDGFQKLCENPNLIGLKSIPAVSSLAKHCLNRVNDCWAKLMIERDTSEKTLDLQNKRLRQIFNIG